jgi:hypothetical protein
MRGAFNADGGSAQAPTLSAFGFGGRNAGVISRSTPLDTQRSPIGQFLT